MTNENIKLYIALVTVTLAGLLTAYAMTFIGSPSFTHGIDFIGLAEATTASSPAGRGVELYLGEGAGWRLAFGLLAAMIYVTVGTGLMMLALVVTATRRKPAIC